MLGYFLLFAGLMCLFFFDTCMVADKVVAPYEMSEVEMDEADMPLRYKVDIFLYCAYVAFFEHFF